MLENTCKNCFEKNVTYPCPYCGYNEELPEKGEILPAGTILNGKFMVGKIIGHGGFGITYLGYDLNFDFKVAIKEYYPDGLCTRTRGSKNIYSYSGEASSNYKYGLSKFVDEGKAMAQFRNLESIVDVREYFMENNSAYLVMEYLEGMDLSQYLKQQPNNKLSWEETKQIILPILNTLDEVHKQGIIHRDISPDNIFITTDNKIKLLDFGAARYAMNDKSKSLSVILKQGYAPPEQYSSRGKQGSWTDVYALGATIFKMMTGKTPVETVERQMDDEEFQEDLKLLPENIRKVIKKSMVLKHNDRIQRVSEFKKHLLKSVNSYKVESSSVSSYKPEKEDISTSVIQNDDYINHYSQNVKKRLNRSKKTSNYGKLALIIMGVILIGFLITKSNNPDTESNNDVLSNKLQEENANAEVSTVEITQMPTPEPTEVPIELAEFKGLDWNDISVYTSYDDNDVNFVVSTDYSSGEVYIDNKYYANLVARDNYRNENQLFFALSDDYKNKVIKIEVRIGGSKERIYIPYFYYGNSGNINKLENLDINCLVLDGDDISGNINSLKKIVGLEFLDIYCKNITGDIIALKDLNNLKGLSLIGSGISGDISSLSDLKDLVFLSIDFCWSIKGQVSSLSDLTSLESLHIGLCGVAGDIKYLDNLTNLKRFSTVNAKDDYRIYGDISVFENFTNLEYIHAFGFDGLTGNIKSLNSLRNLEHLHLEAATQLSGSLNSLTDLHKLEHALFYWCYELSGTLTMPDGTKVTVENGP